MWGGGWRSVLDSLLQTHTSHISTFYYTISVLKMLLQRLKYQSSMLELPFVVKKTTKNPCICASIGITRPLALNLHSILVRNVQFFIPIQLTLEWPLLARSPVSATLTAISFNSFNILWRRYNYAHYSWETQYSKRASDLSPDTETELKFNRESLGFKIFTYKIRREKKRKKEKVARRISRNLTNKEFDKPAPETGNELGVKTRFSNFQSRLFQHIITLPPKVLGFPKRCLDGIPCEWDANRSDPHSSSWINEKLPKGRAHFMCLMWEPHCAQALLSNYR